MSDASRNVYAAMDDAGDDAAAQQRSSRSATIDLDHFTEETVLGADRPKMGLGRISTLRFFVVVFLAMFLGIVMVVFMPCETHEGSWVHLNEEEHLKLDQHFTRSCFAHMTEGSADVLYVFGGMSANETLTNALWWYDGKEWSRHDLCGTAGCKPSARVDHQCAVVENTLIVTGGRSQDSGCSSDHSVERGSGLYVCDDVWALDLDTLEWSERPLQTVGHKPSGRWGHSLAPLRVHSSYTVLAMFGGFAVTADGYTVTPALHWVYVPDLSSWQEVQTDGTTPTGRGYHSFSSIRNMLFSFGGVAQDGTYSDTLYRFALTLAPSSLHFVESDSVFRGVWEVMDRPKALKPPGRIGACMATSRHADSFVLIGGISKRELSCKDMDDCRRRDEEVNCVTDTRLFRFDIVKRRWSVIDSHEEDKNPTAFGVCALTNFRGAQHVLLAGGEHVNVTISARRLNDVFLCEDLDFSHVHDLHVRTFNSDTLFFHEEHEDKSEINDPVFPIIIVIIPTIVAVVGFYLLRKRWRTVRLSLREFAMDDSELMHMIQREMAVTKDALLSEQAEEEKHTAVRHDSVWMGEGRRRFGTVSAPRSGKGDFDEAVEVADIDGSGDHEVESGGGGDPETGAVV